MSLNLQAVATPDIENEKSRKDDLLATARKRFALAAESETEIRREAIDDFKFRKGDQWPQDVKNQRDQDKRPCLTINRLSQSLRQITNDQRQNRPSIKVNPVDSDATVETGEVLEGMVRHIEYTSGADAAYDTAFESQATGGFGYLRVITDYVSPKSFDIEIKIKPVKDAFTVYLDPFIEEPDGNDANWGFVFESMPKDEFKSQYPKAELSTMEDWESLGDQTSDWVTKDGVRVAEYFYKEFKTEKICLYSDGSVVAESEKPGVMPEGITVIDERESIIPTVKWCKTNGYEILKETEWLGSFIPIIPVYGDELIIEGKRTLQGMVRQAKDSQRMYNYWASSETETIALAPKAPFIGAEGQFEGHELVWKTANTKNHAYMEYKAKDIGGTPLPPPQRNMVEPQTAAITNARMAAAEDIKATTGMYDPSLGRRDAQQSGIAIQKLNTQAQTSNFHLVDNFARSLRHVGRIIVELIPKVYKQAQAIRIIKPDGSHEMVLINQIFQKNGKDTIHDLDLGRYDTTVSTGPSYQTKRQEAVASMVDFTRALPQQASVIADILVSNMDWPGHKEIAERLKKTLPPGLIEQKEGEQIPPQAQQALNQFQQQNQMMAQELHKLSSIIENKKLELESKERIALKEMETELAREQMRIDALHSKTMFETEVKNIHKRLDLIGDLAPIASDLNGPGQAAASPQSNDPSQATGGFSPGPTMGAQ